MLTDLNQRRSIFGQWFKHAVQNSIPWTGTCQEQERNGINLKATSLQYHLSLSLEFELSELLNIVNCSWHEWFFPRCKWVLVERQSLQKWQVCEHGWDVPVLLWPWVPAHSWQARMHRQVLCTCTCDFVLRLLCSICPCFYLIPHLPFGNNQGCLLMCFEAYHELLWTQKYKEGIKRWLLYWTLQNTLGGIILTVLLQ